MARCIRLSAVCLFSLAVVTVFPIHSKAHGWGDRGHRVVNLAAIDLMSSPAAAFFKANKDNLARLSLTPDQGWKQSNYQQERPMHFFQWDQYRESALGSTGGGFETLNLAAVIHQIGDDFVKENGSAVWRSADIYAKLVTALRAQDWGKALQMAGVLGHYIGDLSQPMHVTADYDGQSINRSGVHKYFEITLMDTEQEANLVNASVTTGGTLRHGQENGHNPATTSSAVMIRTMAFSEGKRALDDLEPLLALFGRNSQDDNGLKRYFAPRMGSSASTLAQVWDKAVLEAGVTAAALPRTALQVRDPAWFDLDRSNESR